MLRKQSLLIISIVLTGTFLPGQIPVDCVDAIPVCDSQQLNFNSNGPGSDDFVGPNNNANGCLLGDENQSAWFEIYISPTSPPNSTLAFDITPVAGFGEDYDFALYGPNVDCGNLGSPIRCSFADQSCGFCPQTGLGMGTTDFSETFTGDGYVAEVIVQPGQSYILLVDNWLASNQGFFLDWTGTAILSCECTTTATITGDLEICEGETTTLTVLGTNLAGYQWAASGGGSISGPTNAAAINAVATGTYTVTVSDSDGCMGTAEVEVIVAPGPDIDFSITPASCGEDNGAIDLTVSGGSTPFSYNWSNGESSEDLSDLSAGTYTITVTDNDGCTSTMMIEITEDNPQIIIDGFLEANTSCLSGNGFIDVSVTPAGSYNFIWSTGETTEDLFDLPPGDYSLTVTSGTSCTAIANFTITDNPDNPEIFFNTVPTECDLSNGEIDVTITAGTGPFSYEWSGGETSQDLSGLPAGSYTITVTASNGCTAEELITLDNENPPINIDATIEANTDCITQNGSIITDLDPSVSPTGVPYTFLWSNGSTTADLFDLAAGTYTLTVSYGGSCTQTADFSINDDPVLPAITSNIIPANCGQDNGAIDISVTGGIAPYSYLWDDGSTFQDLTSIPAGNYSLTVTGDNGCTAEINLQVPDEPVTFTVNPVILPNTTCTVGGNGSISVEVIPGGTFTFEWSTGDAGNQISGLNPGLYFLTVSAGGTCVQELDFTVPDEPLLPDFGFDINPTLCGELNGAASVVINSGTSPFIFLWSNGETSQGITNAASGNYQVTVTGANECSAVANVQIPNEQIDIEVIDDITGNTSCEAGNGSIDLTIPTSGSFSYQWSGGESTEDLSDLEPGTYTLTISAGGSCEEIFSFTVPDNSVTPVVNLSTTAATCDQANGEIELTTNTGSAPFSYQWSSGEIFEDLTGLFGGSYTVTVTDAFGCTGTATTIVNNNSINMDITGFAEPNTSCQEPNGEVNISIEPQGNYNYAWSNGEAIEDLTGLEPGTYTVTVTLGQICSQTASFTVGDESSEPFASAEVTPAVCGEDNGAIDLTVSGSEPPYTFNWSNGETFEDIADLFPGSYMVTVTASNDCFIVLPVNVPNNSSNFIIDGMAQALTSCEQPNGSIDISIDPPGAYDYEWSNGASTEDIQDLPPGEYTVTVIQAGSCSATSTFTVEDQTVSPTLSVVTSQELCGLQNGSANLTVESGSAPYSFLWSGGETLEDLADLGAGNYTVTVTDANGCTSTSSVNIGTNSIDISIGGQSTPNSNCTNPNGSIDIVVSPPEDYSFTWSNGSDTEDLSDISAGIYTVTVELGSCSANASFNVEADAGAISVSGVTTDIDCFGDMNGLIDLAIEGGQPPYTFDWLPGIPGNPEDPDGLGAGSYEVVVTDQAGCTASAEFTIDQSPALSLACSQSSSVSAPGAEDGSALIQTGGGTPPYTVSWSPGGSESNLTEGDFTIEDLAEGDFTVILTDAQGCTLECSFTINAQACQVQVGTMSQEELTLCGETCVSASYDIMDQYLNPGDVVQFILHEGNGSEIQNELARSDQPQFCFDPLMMNYGSQYYISAVAGVAGTDDDVLLSDPCTQVADGTPVIFHEIPEASITDPDLITCDNTEIQLQGNSSLPASTYAWTTEQGSILSDPGQATIRVDRAGYYSLLVLRNTCKDTAAVNVQASDDIPTLITDPAPDINCKDSVVTIKGSALGADVELIWVSIVGQDTTLLGSGNSLEVTNPGVYHLIGIAQNGCTAAAGITVNAMLDQPVVDAGEDLLLDCNQTPVVLTADATIGVIYQWEVPDGVDISGLDSSRISTGQPGVYYVSVTDPESLCTAVDSVAVIQNDDVPESIVNTEPMSCYGVADASITLDPVAGTGPYNFILNGMDHGDDPVFSGLGAGTYELQVLDALGCSWITILEIDQPDSLFVELGADLSLNPGENATVLLNTNIPSSQIGDVLWTPAGLVVCTTTPCEQVTLVAQESFDLQVLVTDLNGCTATDALSIIVLDEFKLFIPNVFSPNGDGQNDYFTLFGGEQLRNIKQLSIYSRWGELLFERNDIDPKDPQAGWDGSLHGDPLSPGVYVWHAVVDFGNGREEQLYGDVTLIR